MSSLIPFSFESQEIRFIPEGDSFSVVGRDVLLTLDYPVSGGVGKYFDHVPEEWKGGISISTPGGIQEMLTLTEQGFYFFVNRSDKPKALPLQKWVAGDVLPSIRKTGSYSLPGASPQNAVLAAQLAELLQGKVLVDFETLGQVIRLVDALGVMFKTVEPLATELEQQCGQPLMNRGVDTKPRSSPPVSPPVRFQEPDDLTVPIAAYLAGKQAVTVPEIITEALHQDPQNRGLQTRVGACLQRLGWRKKRETDGERRRFYIPMPEKSTR